MRLKNKGLLSSNESLIQKTFSLDLISNCRCGRNKGIQLYSIHIALEFFFAWNACVKILIIP